MSRERLAQLLAKSCANNRRDGLTGMLCAWNSKFAQCLEGHPNDVSRTIERIRSDPRHTDIEVISQVEVEQRHFGDWSMHLVNLDEDTSSADIIHKKYPKLGAESRVFKDPLIVFSLLFDLGLISRAA